MNDRPSRDVANEPIFTNPQSNEPLPQQQEEKGQTDTRNGKPTRDASGTSVFSQTMKASETSSESGKMDGAGKPNKRRGKASANEPIDAAEDDASSSSSDKDGDREDDDKDQQRVSPFQVFKYADRLDIVLMLVGAVCAVGGGAGMPAFSFALGRLLNDLLTADPEESAAQSALIMVYIGIAVTFACMGHVCCWCVAAVRQVGRLRAQYFAAVLRQDIGWHDFHKPGELTARMTGDTRVVQNGINDRFSQGVLNLSMGICGFIFGFVFCWELTLVMLGMMPFVALAAGLMGNVLAKATSATRKQFAAAGSIATEVIENIRTVQVFGKQEFEVERFRVAVKRSEKPGMKRELMNALSVGTTLCLITLTYTVVFFFSGYLLKWGRATVGDCVATFLSVLLGSMGIGFFFPSLTAFTESRCAAYHLFATIQRVPPIDIDESGMPVAGCFDKLSFEKVKFSYPTRPDQVLFTDLNLTIHKGQKVAFSGSSGCGKSSIIGLIQRFYDPIAGAVTVDGVDVRELDLFQWRDQIGIVSQEPNLFHGTMMENVRIGKMDATEEEVIAACKRANIHDTIMGLPQQYHTPVGTVGSQLSGGQKQRIAIARALVKKPSILLLDEATSALDRKSEVEVQSSLDELMTHSNMTIVVIAHRLATIRSVDCIYYVAYDGARGSVIAEQGTFDELMAQEGLFAAMAKAQGTSNPTEEGRTGGSGTTAGTEEHAGQRKEEGCQRRTGNGGGDDREDDDAVAAVFAGNQILTEAQIEQLDELAPRTVRQRVAIEQLANWEVNQVSVTPWRLLSLNKDKLWAVGLGLLGSLVCGAIAPVNTILLGKLLMALAEYSLFFDVDAMESEIRTYAPVFVAVAFAALGGWLLQFFYGYAGELLTTKIRTVLFRQILRQDMSFFDIPGRDAGTLSGMLSGDCEAIHQLCGPAIGIRIQTLCTILVGLIIGLCYEWKLALVAMACVPLVVGAMLLEQKMMSGLNSQKEGDSDDTVVTEALSNVRTVTSFNLKRNRTELFERLLAEERPKRLRRNIFVGVIYGLSQFVYYGSFALCYWYGGKLIKQGEADFETVNVASLAVLMGAMSAGEAGGFAAKVGDAKKASRRVFSIIDRVPDVDVLDRKRREVIEETPAPTAATAVAPAANQAVVKGCEVALRNTLFIYPARPNQIVLASVNLDFPVGTMSGLMGQTGCGKSTIIQLLACFYAHRRGRIVVNGHDIEHLDIRKWRRNISIVLQEPDLFSGTVRDNICYSLSLPRSTEDAAEEESREERRRRLEQERKFHAQAAKEARKRQKKLEGGEKRDTSSDSAGGGSDDGHDDDEAEIYLHEEEEEEENEVFDAPPTEEEVIRAAKWANIHNDILAMPQGYDTYVGYKGRALSGGQKQRVAIARGLLRRDTKLLLLDEATSALDNATEARVQQGLEDYIRYRKEADGVQVTVISIAHRLTTIRHSDQIVLLDGGRIIEQGNHDELMALGGEYKTRWELYAAGIGH